MQASLEEVTKKHEIVLEEVGEKLSVCIIMLLDEMKASLKLALQSNKDANAAKRRETSTARELQALTEKYDTLKDNMRDEVNKVRDLEEKVEEYERLIACIQQSKSIQKRCGT